ncbi:ATP-binding protein [Pseudoxanthomonas sp. Root65]|uniref:sensor histidine kinase n=1 Tax=Pseudoxanthomonas sp. Root65 TaxID=1736576 RepID=UPI00138EE7D8|nr:ATP-binding protein [Pseudoxanthomonas sp. Root65]
MLQLISSLLAVLPALAWAYRAFAVDIPWRPGELTSMALSLSVCAAAAISFVLIRHGRFAWASRLLLVVFAASVVPAYLATGFGAQRFEQPVLVIWMAIAGLVVGRAALWLMFACIVAAFFLGISVDVSRQGDAAALYGDAAFSAAMFLMIAIVLDRSSAALRQSLGEATARGNQLAATNQRLQQEINDRELAQEQLIHARKVEAVGRLAGGVAHDFGNIMAVISGYARKGLRAGQVEEGRASFEGIEAAARRATLLTHKLMTFARQDDYAEETFHAASALMEIQSMLRQLLKPEVELRFALDDAAAPIRMDRDRFELMVLNIAANADHAMPNGGVFSIGVAQGDDGGSVLEFTDTGSGMGEEVLARVFEPFFTTKPAGEGTGLGLSVIRDLVTRVGGTISAHSQLGVGTTFKVALPAAV